MEGSVVQENNLLSGTASLLDNENAAPYSTPNWKVG